MLGLTTEEFLVKLLETGGLPALTIGVLFLIFFFWMRSQANGMKEERRSHSEALIALQREREVVREREYGRAADLMKAYEELTDKFVDVSSETAKALARISERVSYCPFRDNRAHLVTEIKDDV